MSTQPQDIIRFAKEAEQYVPGSFAKIASASVSGNVANLPTNA